MARNLNSPKNKIVESKVLADVFSNDSAKDDDDDGTFFFETDYAALKGNPDYLKLMRTLVILQAQRTKILQDINQLEELKSRTDVDPNGVKELILKGEAPYLQRINVEKVPEIDWSKYKTYNSGDRISRRNKGERSVTVKKENDVTDSDGPVKVRGRTYHEKKPETFNQLWTVEEQLRLEQLLEEYPPEPIENRRWKKIAAALGNRTTKQVCSRVQKYFQKLQKAGIAAPGRINRTRSNRAAHVHKRHKHLLYKPTTFFPGVAMAELSSGSDDEERTVVSHDGRDDLAHWKDILKRIEASKKPEGSDDEESMIVVEHHGFQCGVCGQSPIKGPRWQCRTCSSFSSCSTCMETMPKKSSPPHPLTHHFRLLEEAIAMPEMSRLVKKDNYLDPSYAH